MRELAKIPDIFRPQRKAAEQLYGIYLSRLMVAGHERRAVDACRQIREYARRHRKPLWGDFTYHLEIDALFKLKRFSAAWRQLRTLEVLAFGKNVDMNADSWSADQLAWFGSHHAPILYFLGRYRLAARLLEAMLRERMARPRKGLSYELMGYIYRPIARPRERHNVTLYHAYRKLGKNLVQWPQWKQFITGFRPELFQLARVTKSELLHDPSLLRPFYKAMADEAIRRSTAGVSRGEVDLIADPSEVRRYQEDVRAKKERLAAKSAEIDRKLRDVFPDLDQLHRKKQVAGSYSQGSFGREFFPRGKGCQGERVSGTLLFSGKMG